MGEKIQVPIEIPDSFDDFIKEDKKVETPETESNEEKKETLEERFQNERLEWSQKIKDMSAMMKGVKQVSELMLEIYTERQRAIEYHHYILTLLTKLNKKYRQKYSEKYKHYSWNSQERFPNEKTKELKILSELAEIVEKRELLDNHAKFMDKTVSTIDNLIYGIKYRIEIEQISRGK